MTWFQTSDGVSAFFLFVLNIAKHLATLFQQSIATTLQHAHNPLNLKSCKKQTYVAILFDMNILNCHRLKKQVITILNLTFIGRPIIKETLMVETNYLYYVGIVKYNNSCQQKKLNNSIFVQTKQKDDCHFNIINVQIRIYQYKDCILHSLSILTKKESRAVVKVVHQVSIPNLQLQLQDQHCIRTEIRNLKCNSVSFDIDTRQCLHHIYIITILAMINYQQLILRSLETFSELNRKHNSYLQNASPQFLQPSQYVSHSEQFQLVIIKIHQVEKRILTLYKLPCVFNQTVIILLACITFSTQLFGQPSVKMVQSCPNQTNIIFFTLITNFFGSSYSIKTIYTQNLCCFIPQY
ncbi:unnamed protein product [Paramecium octaurelia]|uniref:Transmembrane protein n=1 Tax=Paramecium octaurelia TaxID=43137 RepID=A0A8S1U0M4_PAROT|nr:unnamed protein product [Paramecium octaurelia]